VQEFARTITVRQLIEAKGKELGLTVLSGKRNAGREITFTSLSRPGLALDGHMENYRPEALQIIGRGEYAFCTSLKTAKLKANFRKMLSAGEVPCVIITSGMKALPGISSACKESGVPLLSTTMETGAFISELIAYLDDCLSPRTHVHGVLVKVSGLGVLIRGDSGIGKSECALELIKRGHILVADDVVEIQRKRGGILYGACPPMLQRYLEVRGLGILDIELLFGVGSCIDSSPIELEVNLIAPSDGFIDRLGMDKSTVNILGAEVSSLTIPVSPGRNLAVLIEVASLNQRLKGQGMVTAKEFNKKLLSKMKERDNGPK